MATVQHTRRALGTRGRVNSRVPAEVLSAEPSCVSVLPQLDGSESASIRQFLSRNGTVASAEQLVPELFMHDGVSFRPASPWQVLSHAQHLIAQRFVRGASLMMQPEVVDALLRVKLAGEPQTVFAALFLDRRYRVLDFDMLFRGTIGGVSIYPREVVREAIHREAEVIIVARNDMAGDSDPTQCDVANAQRLKDALALVDVVLADYLIVGKTVTSLAEMGQV